MTERFQVDLAGVVDLLSHHLYSGPQVYLRELLQNAADALAARREAEPGAPATVQLSVDTDDTDDTGASVLSICDTGVGLTKAEAVELLSTIGRSSKRDPLGQGRANYIGQFGIGLLAAFMVADRLEVTSRSLQPGALPVTWTGFSDGTFSVRGAEPAAAEAIPIGTTVRLWARRGHEHWLQTSTVLALATEYGSLLPVDVAVRVPVDGAGPMWRRVTEPELPWLADHATPEARNRALTAYCERTFGFTPLGHIDLEVPLAGVTGVAFVLPQAVTPGTGRHRVYVKRMLVGPRVDGLLPDWAFFVRAVLDCDALSLTASREQIHQDEVLFATRDALATQLKTWAASALATPSQFARDFISAHQLALRSLALADDDMLELAARVLPFETTDGVRTLADIAEASGDIVYTTTTEAYFRVADVARAQGLIVVNAGYVYDADLLGRLGRRSGWRVRELSSDDVRHVLAPLSSWRAAQVATAVAVADQLMEADDCEVVVRAFEPDHLPAVLLRDPAGERRRDLARERDATPGLWGGLLDTLADGTAGRTRTLALNDRSDVVRQLLAAPDSGVFAAGLRSLYLSAVMLAGEGLRAAEARAMHDALTVLLTASLRSSP